MDNYYLAPSLVELRSEIDAAHPHRDHTSDGWVGDARHASEKSDHNPDYTAGGVVRAIDVDKDGIDVPALLAKTIKDSRTNYAIWDGHIYSRAYNFAKRVYTGASKHDHHIHISIRHGKTFENSTKKWGYTPSVPKPAPKPAPAKNYGNCVKLQKALRLDPDNNWGDGTDKACEAVRQAAHKQFPYGAKFVQRIVGVDDDGAWGGVSRRALKQTIVAMQVALIEESHTKFPRTGVWDAPTEAAYQKVRKICRRP